MTDPRKPPEATPALGALDQLQLDDPRRPSAPEPPPAPLARRSRAWWLLLPVLLAAVAALALWRDSISERLVPESELNREIEAAQLALARGELSRPDGSGARERFQAVLARDPDHPVARSGLAAVREAALVQARAAAEAGDADAAREHLALARAMAAPAAALAPIEALLQRREGDEAAIAERLQRALQAPPEVALELYAEVLRLQPDNAIALEGRRALLATRLRVAGEALDAGRLDEAGAIVDAVMAIDPSHLDLPALQARLGEARAALEAERARALRAARADLAAGRIDDAARGFQALLARDPALEGARDGLADAAAALAERAVREAADFDFDAAAASLARARAWAPGLPALDAAEARIERARIAAEQMPARVVDPAELAALLADARAAMRAGALIEPPGDSAWDHLRRAAALAPGDAGVREALGEYDRRARACFEDELASNRLTAAQACLDAMAARARGGDALPAERRRLADRWLAFAEERLGANELALARRALESARTADPAHPALEAFAERLRRAGG